MMTTKKIVTFSAAALFAVAVQTAAFCSAEPTRMKAILTVPHEFDMLVKSGHIQGLACSEKGLSTNTMHRKKSENTWRAILPETIPIFRMLIFTVQWNS